jgi:hypothetical protein
MINFTAETQGTRRTPQKYHRKGAKDARVKKG